MVVVVQFIEPHIGGAHVCQRGDPCARGGQTMSSAVGMPVARAGLLREPRATHRCAVQCRAPRTGPAHHCTGGPSSAIFFFCAALMRRPCMTRPTSPQSVGTSYAHMSSGGGRGVAAVVAGGARVWRRESDGMGPVTHHDVRVLAAALPPRQKGGGAGARARGWRELARPAPAARRCATASHAKKKQLAVTESRGQSRACVHCQAPLAAAGLRGVAAELVDGGEATRRRRGTERSRIPRGG